MRRNMSREGARGQAFLILTLKGCWRPLTLTGYQRPLAYPIRPLETTHHHWPLAITQSKRQVQTTHRMALMTLIMNQDMRDLQIYQQTKQLIMTHLISLMMTLLISGQILRHLGCHLMTLTITSTLLRSKGSRQLGAGKTGRKGPVINDWSLVKVGW